jgi:pantoate--beta-alanine ligase
MTGGIEIVRSRADLRRRIQSWRARNLSVGLVPTMGALHDGHFSLVEKSLGQMDRTCATLFVNPTQFAPGEDLDTYPREEAADAAALAERDVDLLYAPPLDEMYPDGMVSKILVPGIGDILEGGFRPGFFTGVATVVAKLLLQSLPDRAYFGDKDYQQLCIIRRMVDDLNIPVEIEGCPIIRETDGLALSSRNAYLNKGERKIAPGLHQALQETARRITAGEGIETVLTDVKDGLLTSGFTNVDYVSVCHPETLTPLNTVQGRARILAAASLGKTRLIDNIGVGD